MSGWELEHSPAAEDVTTMGLLVVFQFEVYPTCLTKESFKFGCYNSLDNSRPALWERVVKMGLGLMETLKIEVLGNNTRKNNVKTFLLANELWLNFSGSLPGLSTFFHSSLIVWFLMDMIANRRSQHFLAISPETIVKYSGSNHIYCILHKLFPSLFFIQKICHDILIGHHWPTHSKDSVVCRILQLACSLSCEILNSYNIKINLVGAEFHNGSE
nr:hypothetical protein CFP56_15724 [Quercus suber]